MSFRTKLLCVIAVPVIVLLAISGLAASDSLEPNAVAMIAAGGAFASIAVCLVLARRVAQPLTELTAAAEALATVHLPALIEGLSSPSEDDHRYLAATIKPIKVRAGDEIGQLARAFNTVQTVAVDVAAEQSALLRKGIADLFVNLARRNQLLIDRQIEMFDQLESTETDPVALSKLYKLDHLTTRMRRNAESLLVLSGAETTRRRTEPVPLVDVLRAAIGETEDYSRIDLAHVDEVQLTGLAAVDVGHLLAELLENAAQLSPPETRVTIEGRMVKSAYDLVLTDHGVGMTADALASANELLASAPPLGFVLSKTLGFTVVSRLAAKHAVSVRLSAGPEGGVVASVHLPSQLIVVAAGTTLPAPPPPPPVAAAVVEPVVNGQLPESDFDELVRRAWVDDPVDDDGWAAAPKHMAADDATEVDEEFADQEDPIARGEGSASDEPHGGGDSERSERSETTWQNDPVPVQLSQALPQGRAFEAGVHALAQGDSALGPATLVEPAIVADAVPQDDAVAAPELTEAGLTRRKPKSPAPATAAPAGPSILASNRSPDEVRTMLAKYRTGMEQAKAGEAPSDIDGGT